MVIDKATGILNQSQWFVEKRNHGGEVGDQTGAQETFYPFESPPLCPWTPQPGFLTNGMFQRCGNMRTVLRINRLSNY
jgi:hypothetical protein